MVSAKALPAALCEVIFSKYLCVDSSSFHRTTALREDSKARVLARSRREMNVCVDADATKIK